MIGPATTSTSSIFQFGLSFEEYFRAYVEVPRHAPAEPYEKRWRMKKSINYCIPDDAGVLQIAQGYGPMKKPDLSTISLNIQASKQVNKSCADVAEDELWGMFEKLRFAKSRSVRSMYHRQSEKGDSIRALYASNCLQQPTEAAPLARTVPSPPMAIRGSSSVSRPTSERSGLLLGSSNCWLTTPYSDHFCEEVTALQDDPVGRGHSARFVSRSSEEILRLVPLSRNQTGSLKDG